MLDAIDVTPLPMVTSSKDEHVRNILWDVTAQFITALLRLGHPENAPMPTVVTDAGIVTVVRPLLLNVIPPTDVSVFGNSMLPRLVQYWKTE